MESLRFIDLFSGLGGFHQALSSLGHECVFAAEIDPTLRENYLANFPEMDGRVFGDIRETWTRISEPFDVLCAGFPCQPFSKSGEQRGVKDETRGTLFHEIIRILKEWNPDYVILENVGNFERHDRGNTWRVVKDQLLSLGYNVRATEHMSPLPEIDWRDRNGGPRRRRFRVASRTKAGIGLISPHHFGYPQHRGRFFALASRNPMPENPFPQRKKRVENRLDSVVQKQSELSDEDQTETRLKPQQVSCIDHWNELLRALPKATSIPSFPIWGDEIGATYPYENHTPWATSPRQLAATLPGKTHPPYTRKRVLLELLPSYAREEDDEFRSWKKHYIRSNRQWWESVRKFLPSQWVSGLREFPPSLRKLEWNVSHEGGSRNIWQYVLQFRPSGLRVKSYTSSPALVAMTSSQIPILGPERRYLTRVEGLRLQGFPDSFVLPKSRTVAFHALGNAVHVGVVRKIAVSFLNKRPAPVQLQLPSDFAT
jgi:DNA (cytosine-5)-methyltransferase 1